MKNYSKLFAVVLCLSMILSCIPGMAFTAKAAEADITKPTGISIVENYDAYVGSDWVSALGLPEKVSVGGVDTPVEWEDAAQYVNPEKTGWYSVPGTVNGVKNAVSITIQVREYKNLFNEITGYNLESNTNNLRFKGNTVAFVTTPCIEGKKALKETLSGYDTIAPGIYTEYSSNIKGRITAYGYGDYYCAVYICSSLQQMTATAEFRKGSNTAGAAGTAVEIGAEYAKVGVLANVDASYTAPRFQVNYSIADQTQVLSTNPVYLDGLEMVAVKIPLTEEPEVITAISTEFPTLSIVEQYDTYVGDDWQTALGLPAEVDATLADGTAVSAVPVTWDYSDLKLDACGRYVLTGTLGGEDYLSTVTAQQVIYVRPYVNLFANIGYDFEGDNTKTKCTFNGTAEWVTTDVKAGERAIKQITSYNISFQGAYTNNSTNIKGQFDRYGDGEYYCSVWMKTECDNFKVTPDYRATDSTVIKTGSQFTIGNEYTKVEIVAPVTAEHKAPRFMLNYSDGNSDASTHAIYLDHAELIPLKMVLTDVPEMIVKGATVDLENSLDMNFYIDQAQLTEGETYTAKIVHTYADGSEDVKNVAVDTANVDSTGYCYVTYQNIAAKEMGDLITVTFSDSQGNIIAVWTDSVKQYVERLMADKAEDAKLQTLCVDLLNYGAAAQQAFNYNVNNLVNADLNGQEGTTGVTATNTATGSEQWKGTTLTLESNITMELFFAKDALTEGATATVSYTDHTGANVSENVEVKLDAYYDMWSVKVENLVIADTNTAVTVTIGEITVTDSMASYVARSQVSNTDAIYNAILAVGTSARAYFNS